ncbi:ADP-ribose-binding protein [Desulfurispira natronophila]|uniref:Macro domain-containing protein n=1 Tax=Desulfurispira natronophila TaxID=682562 RepID=A0A7W7Y274_9BACT|nr:ADP-ribose-binding protein [Desulfurispira natronophila]MBB5020720.1 hypothetical protein [Desulfurispira natronophila]
MKEVTGNLWDYLGLCPLVITTGGQVSRRGNALMLRGCAAEARKRFPGIERELGALIEHNGNRVFALSHSIVSFPVEESPNDLPDIGIIRRSCRELVELTNMRNWPQVAMPRPGCGSGGLAWGDVAPVLHDILDSRFIVVSFADP